MAFQDSSGYVAGSALTWTSSGGGTYILTGTSLGAGSTRQGGKTTTTLVQAPPSGSTAILPDFLRFLIQLQFVSAPAAGGEVQLYLGFSSSTTAGNNNPAGLTGVDGAGPNTDTFGGLLLAGSLVASNNLGMAIQLSQYLDVIPKDIAFSPVLYNNASVALDATASHTIITMVPYYRERQT